MEISGACRPNARERHGARLWASGVPRKRPSEPGKRLPAQRVILAGKRMLTSRVNGDGKKSQKKSSRRNSPVQNNNSVLLAPFLPQSSTLPVFRPDGRAIKTAREALIAEPTVTGHGRVHLAKFCLLRVLSTHVLTPRESVECPPFCACRLWSEGFQNLLHEEQILIL